MVLDSKLDFNPLMTNVPHHIETNQLICNTNQLTGLYMMGKKETNQLICNTNQLTGLYMMGNTGQ